MTRRWTDYPITGAIPRRKAHIGEMMQAYEERVRVICNDSNQNYGEFPHIPDATRPFLYECPKLPNNKLWGDDYPKADPAHWPPNNEPDNEFKDYHVTGCRGLALGQSINDSLKHGYRAVPGYSFYDPGGTIYMKSLHRFFKDDGKYILYRWLEADADDAIGNFLTLAFGSTDWTDKVLSPSVLVKAAHINEVRACFELLQLMSVHRVVYSSQWRQKSGTSSWCDTPGEAWAEAKTNFLAASWWGWQDQATDSPVPIGLARISRRSSDGKYEASIAAQECKLFFDLDLEISDMGWNILPPLVAKLICYGQYVGGDYYFVDGFFGKCVTTGVSADIPEQNADGRGYVLDDDITAYFGSGHGNQEFVLSSKNEWSSADMELLRPADPGVGETNTKNCRLTALGVGGNPSDAYTEIYPGSVCFPVFQPDWHFGTE